MSRSSFKCLFISLGKLKREKIRTRMEKRICAEKHEKEVANHDLIRGQKKNIRHELIGCHT